MQTRIADFRRLEAELLAVSVDSMERGRALANEEGLEFPLLSDPDLKAIDAFGVRHAAGHPSGVDMARPATFIIDRSGKIIFRDLTDNWRVRPRPEELLAAMAAVKRRP